MEVANDNVDLTINMEYTTAVKSKEVLNTCKMLRARLLFTQATLRQAKSVSRGDGTGKSSDTVSKKKIQEVICRINIQEEALKLAKLSRLAMDAVQSGKLPLAILELFKQYASYQYLKVEKAAEIERERTREIEATTNVLVQRSESIRCLERDKHILESRGSADGSENEIKMAELRKKVAEIRLLQICISQFIAVKQVDFTKNKKLLKIIKSTRDPITSVEYFL